MFNHSVISVIDAMIMYGCIDVQDALCLKRSCQGLNRLLPIPEDDASATHKATFRMRDIMKRDSTTPIIWLWKHVMPPNMKFTTENLRSFREGLMRCSHQLFPNILSAVFHRREIFSDDEKYAMFARTCFAWGDPQLDAVNLFSICDSFTFLCRTDVIRNIIPDFKRIDEYIKITDLVSRILEYAIVHIDYFVRLLQPEMGMLRDVMFVGNIMRNKNKMLLQRTSIDLSDAQREVLSYNVCLCRAWIEAYVLRNDVRVDKHRRLVSLVMPDHTVMLLTERM